MMGPSLLRAAAAVLLLLISAAATAAAESTTRWSLAPSNTAFLPRGGGAIGFRKEKSTNTQEHIAEQDGGKEEQEVDDEKTSLDEAGSDTQVSPFQRAYREEVSEIKKSQQFLQMQQRRRELDKTWLDKGITAVIELFENMFRWEVID
ncbi:hypothetical protein ACHAXM_010246 [Skeletonema potamos]|jgi:hypothetical protein